MALLDEHPELVEPGGETVEYRKSTRSYETWIEDRITRRRVGGTKIRTVVTQPHRHRPPFCCGYIITRPMTEEERKDEGSALRHTSEVGTKNPIRKPKGEPRGKTEG